MKNEKLDIRKYKYLLMLFWFCMIGLSFFWNIYTARQGTYEIARAEVETIFNRDVRFRKWAARHGGVYVNETAPNPYLAHLPERDIVTPSGKTLTLVNPAYMIRQVNELTFERDMVKGHITSLKPIRPENSPEPWEKEALVSFEKGAEKTEQLIDIGGSMYFRLMKPLYTEKLCLQCHADQDIRRETSGAG